MAASRTQDPIVVVGAGIGGLACAIRLAAAGERVVLLDKDAQPGGKMRATPSAAGPIDVGPTVLTLKDVFEGLFEIAGERLGDHVRLTPACVLARHAWGGGRDAPPRWLDLYPDIDRSAEAIGDFAGAAEARAYRAFYAESERVWSTLRRPYLEAQQTNVLGLTARVGLTRPAALMAIRPFETLWRSLERQFGDPRLRQLFGRYATYCGASPFRAPATLMLIAHVEREGVWFVDGGMAALAKALADLARRCGVDLRQGERVDIIETSGGRASGVRLATGERLAAKAVIANADPAALAQGLLGPAVRRATPPLKAQERSLSAVTLAGAAVVEGGALERHTVFFSDDYPGEFAALAGGMMPEDPTLYLCAQDRPGDLAGPERVFALINAPARGDHEDWPREAVERCRERMERRLAACGVRLTWREEPQAQTPRTFGERFPGTGGALYGPAMHGWAAAFRRPGARTRLPGLYLAGGGAHPGAGAPMAALSGALAAAATLSDLVSTRRSPAAATPGGTSMRSARTASAG